MLAQAKAFVAVSVCGLVAAAGLARGRPAAKPGGGAAAPGQASKSGQGQAPPLILASDEELANMISQVSEQVRRLANNIATGLSRSAIQQQLSRDSAELAQSLAEFTKGLGARPDAYRLRRAFSSVDGSWHHLRSMLDQPGVSTLAMNRDLQSIDTLDDQLHKALRVGELPDNYYGQATPPGEPADLQRLARALADRASWLASAVQTDLPANDPNRGIFVTRAVDLGNAAHSYLDVVDVSNDRTFRHNAFATVAMVADALESDLARSPHPERVQESWEAFAHVELAVRQALGLPVPPPRLPNIATTGGQARVLALANQLEAQIDAFLQSFQPAGAHLPDGANFLADAQRFRSEASEFRQDAARNLSLGRLAYEFRDVDAVWQRLSRRALRLAAAKSGPNIKSAYALGDTCAELHRLLSIPGYPVDLRNPAGLPIVPMGDNLNPSR